MRRFVKGIEMRWRRFLPIWINFSIAFVLLPVFATCRYAKASSPLIHLSVLQSPIQSLDPLTAVDTNTQLIINNAFDGLVEWDEERGISPSIAESWTVSPDQLTFEFKLRQNVYFSNGTRLTAGDVVRHFRRILDHHSYFSDHFKIIHSITLKGNYVVFKLRHPYPHFLLLLSGVAGKVAKAVSGTFIGSGPFVPSITKSAIILHRVNSYWRDLPSVDGIEFQFADQQKAIELARAQKVDDVAIFALNGDEIKSIGSWIDKSVWATWIIGFDERVQPFDRLPVRNELVNRLKSSSFVSDLYPGQLPAAALFPFGIPGFLDKPPAVQEIKNEIEPIKLSVNLPVFIPTELGNKDKLVAWIKRSLDGSNVTLVPRFMPFDWMIRNYAKGKMGSFLLSINAEYPDPLFILRALKSDSQSNFLGIKDQYIDKMIVAADQVNDPTKTATFLRAINTRLLQLRATVNLMQVRHHAWTRNCVSGLKLSPISEGYINYRGITNRCH